ncbi:MAG: PspC domain-containing protein [Prevotellaceae bacterium]|jgi:phage shock protein PspC (stress-responsive transcriptional regulator)|nr:PspC domain-containing protein [Prevotellaceae bacterium]
MKRLYKSNNRMLCGVCAGVAEYFDVDPTLIRALFVLFGWLLPYIVLAILMPNRIEINN